MFIANLYNNPGSAWTVYGTVSGNTLTIPSQTPTGSATVTISGTGTYTSAGLTLAINYTASAAGVGSITCTFTGVKQ